MRINNVNTTNLNKLKINDDFFSKYSLRFNSVDNCHLIRTPIQQGNRQISTLSFWFKRGNIAIRQVLFSIWDGLSATDSNRIEVVLNSNDQIQIVGGTTTWRTTNRLFLDSASWYNIVVVFNTTDTTANNRIRLYVNGLEETSFSVLNNPSINFSLPINSESEHRIGSTATSDVDPFDGYIWDVNWVDGGIEPNSFGKILPDTKYFYPFEFVGEYGINGFRLDFSTNNSVSNLGLDKSGNNNNFTTNNFSITAGSGNDSLLDTPINNYPVLNPLDEAGSFILSNGNLQIDGVSQNDSIVSTAYFPSNQKWMMEVTYNGNTGTAITTQVGLNLTFRQPSLGVPDIRVAIPSGAGAQNTGIAATATGTIPALTTGTTLTILYNPFSRQIFFRTGGILRRTVNLNTTFNGLPLIPEGFRFQIHGNASVATGSHSFIVNFGQRPFLDPVAGYKSLSSIISKENLQIIDTSSNVNVISYTGSGSSQTLPLKFLPQFQLFKGRTETQGTRLIDSSRGNGLTFTLSTNAAEASLSGFSTNSSGFTVPANTSGISTTGQVYNSYNYAAGNSSGLEIIQWTGNNTSNRLISHNLGQTPAFIICKRRSGATANFYVKHSRANSTTGFLLLNTNANLSTSNTPWGTGTINQSSFMVTNNATNNLNALSVPYIAYLWKEIPGFSRFSTYTGNTTDFPFVFCGFKPKVVIIKKTTGTGSTDWVIWNIIQNPVNLSSTISIYNILNTAAADVTSSSLIYPTSTGFRINTTNAIANLAGAVYAFAAWAENPFEQSNAL